MVKVLLSEPTRADRTTGKKTIKVGAAYEREFERYLVRQNLEEVPRLVKPISIPPKGSRSRSKPACSPPWRWSRRTARRASRNCCPTSSARRDRRKSCDSRNFPMSPAWAMH